MRPLVLGGAAVGAVLVAAAGIVALSQSLDPPPPRELGGAVQVVPMAVTDADYRPLTGVCLAPQRSPEPHATDPAGQVP